MVCIRASIRAYIAHWPSTMTTSTPPSPPFFQVCCGGQHAAILTASGHIYTWGRGGFGRLGHGDDAMCLAPKLVKSLADDGVLCRQVRGGGERNDDGWMDGWMDGWVDG
jgi:alpha-tubulin suppressor-like RCC1 family protein